MTVIPALAVISCGVVKVSLTSITVVEPLGETSAIFSIFSDAIVTKNVYPLSPRDSGT